MTHQIFVKDADRGHVVGMKTDRNDPIEKKEMTIDDFRDGRQIEDEEMYTLRINYEDQEKLDKANINDLLATDRNYKISKQASKATMDGILRNVNTPASSRFSNNAAQNIEQLRLEIESRNARTSESMPRPD